MEIKKAFSAGGVVYKIVDGVPHFLLLNKTDQGWVIPKGTVEAGENMETTALREISEEAGLSKDKLRVVKKLGDLETEFFKDTVEYYKVTAIFLVEDISGAVPSPQAKEAFTEAKYFELDEAFEVLAYQNLRPYLVNAFDYLSVDRQV